ncbi:MAG TPA: prepilin-type N-terminal cleavage/methylation domain-containing protein [Terriglobales bacterium]|nr:prepilin-type N-terminal cleavage/methylation domain-containing protein [Terriglobales bacterium]
MSYSRKSRGGRTAGFTLLELLIVLVIGTILTIIAIPSYSALTKTYRIRKDADSIASLANMARMRAASDFARAQMSCSSTTSMCTLLVWPYGASSGTTETAQTVVLSAGVSFGIPTGITAGAGGQSAEAPYQGSRVQTIANSIFFNSRGQPIANDSIGTAVTDYAIYLVGSDGSSMAVGVDASGRPIVYRLVGTKWVIATN